MNDTKPFWKSKTLWGVVILILPVVYKLYTGQEMSAEAQAEVSGQIEDLGVAVAGIVGTVLAIWGRFTAGKSLGVKSSLLLLPLLLIGCTSPAKTSSDSAEGSPGFTSYYVNSDGATTMHSPEGLPLVHLITDADGAETIDGSQPTANMGFVIGDARVFIHSPSDVIGSGWHLTMPEGLSLDLDEIAISKSQPIEKKTDWVALIQERMETLDPEVQQSIRTEMTEWAQTIRETVPELSDLILRAFVPVP